jgi:hypothetical protein
MGSSFSWAHCDIICRHLSNLGYLNEMHEFLSISIKDLQGFSQVIVWYKVLSLDFVSVRAWRSVWKEVINLVFPEAWTWVYTSISWLSWAWMQSRSSNVFSSKEFLTYLWNLLSNSIMLSNPHRSHLSFSISTEKAHNISIIHNLVEVFLLEHFVPHQVSVNRFHTHKCLLHFHGHVHDNSKPSKVDKITLKVWSVLLGDSDQLAITLNHLKSLYELGKNRELSS